MSLTKELTKVQVKARILYIENSVPHVGLTVLPHLMQYGQPIDTASWPSIGSFWKESVVTSLHPKEGLQLALQDAHVAAYLPKSRLKDAPKETKEDTTSAAKSAALTDYMINTFGKGESVPLCRVTKHALVDGVVHVSTQPSILQMPFLRPEDAVPGTRCEAIIKKVYDGKATDRTGLLVDVAGVYGWVSKVHLADVLLGQNMISKKFKEGAKLKCRVQCSSLGQVRKPKLNDV